MANRVFVGDESICWLAWLMSERDGNQSYLSKAFPINACIELGQGFLGNTQCVINRKIRKHKSDE